MTTHGCWLAESSSGQLAWVWRLRWGTEKGSLWQWVACWEVLIWGWVPWASGRERSEGHGLDFAVPQMCVGRFISNCCRKSSTSKNEVKFQQKPTEEGLGGSVLSRLLCKKFSSFKIVAICRIFLIMYCSYCIFPCGLVYRSLCHAFLSNVSERVLFFPL